MTRGVARWCLAAVVASLLAVPAGPALAQSFPACPTALPLGQVVPGLEGEGLTTASGTAPEAFDVEVVDVLADGIAPGVPLIVVETDSPAIQAAGGIWSGMSGSPVYVDGQLLGAIAYGFSDAPSTLGGVTPAAAMLAVPGLPGGGELTTSAVDSADGAEDLEVATSATVRAAARADGLTASAAATMAPLRVPVRMAGPSGAKFTQAANAFEQRHPGTQVVRSGGSVGTGAADVSDIVPGGNLGVSLAYGDYTAAGVGTVTTVCDGVVTGFGHPMLWSGATVLGLHPASAVTVVRDTVWGSYKLANVASPVGTIDQDRLAAVAGRLGAMPPTLAVTSTITETDGGRTVTGRTDGVHPDEVFGTVLTHGWINFDAKAFDDLYKRGSSEVTWTIRGTRAGGAPFALTRSNRHADLEDLSTASLVEVATSAETLARNPFERVRLTAVEYTATGGSPYRADQIAASGVQVSVDGGPFEPLGQQVEVTSGATLQLSVPLRRYQDPSANRTVTLDLEVPDDVWGWGELLVTGGGYGLQDPFECLYDPSVCEQGEGDGFDELLDAIASAPREDDLVVTLMVWPEGEGELDGGIGTTDEPGEVTSVSSTRRLDTVVRGEAYGSVVVTPPWMEDPCADGVEVPFPDVSSSNPHHEAIGCAALLGIARGTADVPPRFLPAAPIRRDQAAAMLARTLDLGAVPLPDPGALPFGDLAGNRHAPDIARLVAAGILTGKTATTFAPSAEVSREQVASMLLRALRWQTGEPWEPDGEGYFDDVTPGGTHAANIDAGYELGLWYGDGEGSFRPRSSTRRDQMASLLIRYRGLTFGL